MHHNDEVVDNGEERSISSLFASAYSVNAPSLRVSIGDQTRQRGAFESVSHVSRQCVSARPPGSRRGSAHWSLRPHDLLQGPIDHLQANS